MGHDKAHLHDGADGSGSIAATSIPSLPQVIGFPYTPAVVGPPCGAAAVSANRGYWFRSWFSGSCTKIGIIIPTSSGNIEVGFYGQTGSGITAKPGTKTRTSGSVASPGTGYQEISLGGTAVVAMGDWFYFSADNTSINVYFSASSTPGGGPNAMPTAFGCGQNSVGPGSAPASGASVFALSPGGSIWAIGQ